MHCQYKNVKLSTHYGPTSLLPHILVGLDAPVLAHNVLFLIIVFAHGATGTAHLHQQFQSSPEKSLSRSSDIWTPQLFVVLLKSASLGEPLPTMICRSAEY